MKKCITINPIDAFHTDIHSEQFWIVRKEHFRKNTVTFSALGNADIRHTIANGFPFNIKPVELASIFTDGVSATIQLKHLYYF